MAMRNYYTLIIVKIILAWVCGAHASETVSVKGGGSLEKLLEENKLEENVPDLPNASNLNDSGYHEYLDPINAVKVELKATVSVGLFQMDNANFGAGTVDFKNPEIVTHNVFWSEYAAVPKTRITKTLDNTSSLYTKIGVALSATRGQGDACPVSTTSNKPNAIAYERLVMGWKSGNLFGTEDLVHLSVGKQSFEMGDGFLIANGTAGGYKRAAFYMNPQSAFKETAILSINSLPVRGMLFYLKSNTCQNLMDGKDQPLTFMYGTNIEYASPNPEKPSKDYWSVGLAVLDLYKAAEHASASEQKNRDGLIVFNPRVGGEFFPGDRNIRFFSGYVYQKNNKPGRKTRASAYYISPGYKFRDVWGSPYLLYRYSHFSGDANPEGTTKKSYDPLMYGSATRLGFGTWENGQIHGTFYFTNTNQNVHTVQLKVRPSEKYTLGLQYFIINFDKKQQFDIQSKSGSREIDAYFTWNPDTNFSLTAITGALQPKAGIKELTALDRSEANPYKIGKTVYFFGLMLNYAL